ncbi:MAG TPA: alkaline phosphatase family protein [Gemmataceae bacterium]|nr:alkaline phosphatase family protein [Gemmataceae bacterium]
MTDNSHRKPNRRTFLKGAVAAGVAAGGCWSGSVNRVSRSAGKKVIVVGIDGMDPVLSATMMKAGELPNLSRLRDQGGFSPLATSIPPQSPVAWANFINGAGPGSHGIFDFIHRHPESPNKPFYAAAETVDGKTLLRRQGVPFWDLLDAAGVPCTFYDLPSNYPPSPSHHGHCRCISGMGTPDMLGTYGTYQHFADDGPADPLDEAGGKRCKLTFDQDTAVARIVGPTNNLEKDPKPLTVEFRVHRDRESDAAAIEIQGHKVLLKAGQWSKWTKLRFELPWQDLANVSGIIRFYLQAVSPHFRLYVSPVNMDPSAPAMQISEPESFIQDVSKKIGLFYTTGFQEDYSARKNGVFNDDEYLKQAGIVLEERLALFDHAVHDYDDGLLFFYFSSSDLQSHMFWWDSDAKHPTRTADEAKKYYGHVRRLYQRLDQVVGDLMDRYADKATIFVMSDHGFANFGRQFNLNSWLRDWGYLTPPNCTSVLHDVDWTTTTAYGLGINGLYLNLKGREKDGIVEPGDIAKEKLAELKERLEDVKDANGESVIRTVYRADEIYSGNATALAPDLIIGYRRGYRASWATCLGDLTQEFLLDNDSAWSADHCADALEVPGVLFCNRPMKAAKPALWDVAPSVLAEFGIVTPASMSGKSIFL